MRCPYRETEDGFEIQFGVNHLGHFLLTNLLLDRLKEAPAARIVVVSSASSHHKAKEINFDDINNKQSYDPALTYYRSKLCNFLFVRALAKRLTGTNVTVNCLHPGTIYTDVARYMNLPFWAKILLNLAQLLVWKSPWYGVQTIVYCVIAKEMEGVSGAYIVECKKTVPAPQAQDDLAAEKLWSLSVKLTGL